MHAMYATCAALMHICISPPRIGPTSSSMLTLGIVQQVSGGAHMWPHSGGEPCH